MFAFCLPLHVPVLASESGKGPKLAWGSSLHGGCGECPCASCVVMDVVEGAAVNVRGVSSHAAMQHSSPAIRLDTLSTSVPCSAVSAKHRRMHTHVAHSCTLLSLYDTIHSSFPFYIFLFIYTTRSALFTTVLIECGASCVWLLGSLLTCSFFVSVLLPFFFAVVWLVSCRVLRSSSPPFPPCRAFSFFSSLPPLPVSHP